MIPKPTGLCQSFTGAPHSRHPLSYVYQRHFRLNKLQTDLFTVSVHPLHHTPPSRLPDLLGSSGQEPGLTLQPPSVTPTPSPSPIEPTCKQSHPVVSFILVASTLVVTITCLPSPGFLQKSPTFPAPSRPSPIHFPHSCQCDLLQCK